MKCNPSFPSIHGQIRSQASNITVKETCLQVRHLLIGRDLAALGRFATVAIRPLAVTDKATTQLRNGGHARVTQFIHRIKYEIVVRARLFPIQALCRVGDGENHVL